ncbi:hypothetical protein P9X10_02675 [Bacillus cereus]|nr:hypothetical protein [Bacillus cereus]
MNINVYVKLDESPTTEYIRVSQMFLETDIESKYKQHEDTMKSIGSRYESFEGYKLVYLLINVKYDGRRKSLSDEDIMKSLETQGFVIKVGDSMLGGFYKKTPKLKELLEEQLKKRKLLVSMV